MQVVRLDLAIVGAINLNESEDFEIHSAGERHSALRPGRRTRATARRSALGRVVATRGVAVWFKIAAYDLDYAFASENPADPACTRRVLTLLLPDEY